MSEQNRLIWNGFVGISYSQFVVHDLKEPDAGLYWEDAHLDQGFARTRSCANVAALIESGDAQCQVTLGAPPAGIVVDRLISTPFEVVSDGVFVGGPEEINSGRNIPVPSARYRLFIGQQIDAHDDLHVLLFFARADKDRLSRIHTRDDLLTANEPLREDARPADA